MLAQGAFGNVEESNKISIRVSPVTFAEITWNRYRRSLHLIPESKFLSRVIPSHFNFQFIRYGLVGATGVGVHFFTLYLFYVLLGFAYPVSLLFAIETAIVSNYLWNNQWTFRENRLLGIFWWKGLARYNLACVLGSAFNFAIGWYLVDKGISWFVASALGIWVGVSWNYLTNRFFTWG